MGKRTKQSNDGMDPTLIALLVASLGGAGIIFYADSAWDDVRKSVGQHAPTTPGWQVHMGSTCSGAAAFVVILFLLELLGRQSKIAACRSSWPWLPLIGLTALATLIHIPVYAVVPIGVVSAAWAYRRTRNVR
jgi:hypothetical protein